MEIIHPSGAIHKEKADGTRVDYYLQKEYEIHYNEMPPGTLQEWHSHKILEEAVFIIDGSLELRWIANKKENKITVNRGDLIRVENSTHTFANISNKNTVFIVFKIVLDGGDNSKIFKWDKIPTKC